MEQAKQRHSFAYQFYKSWEWQCCRAAYLKKEPLCERCGQPAQQVHHKTKLTPQNIKDPNVALNFENLEALCEDCHKQEHHPTIRWRCDAFGHVEL